MRSNRDAVLSCSEDKRSGEILEYRKDSKKSLFKKGNHQFVIYKHDVSRVMNDLPIFQTIFFDQLIESLNFDLQESGEANGVLEGEMVKNLILNISHSLTQVKEFGFDGLFDLQKYLLDQVDIKLEDFSEAVKLDIDKDIDDPSVVWALMAEVLKKNAFMKAAIGLKEFTISSLTSDES